MIVNDPILAAFNDREKRGASEPLTTSMSYCWSVGDVAALARAVASSILTPLSESFAVVGLAAPNGPGFVAGFLALRQVGAVVLLFDWRTPRSERIRCAGALGAKAILEIEKQWPEGPDDFTLRELEQDTKRKGIDIPLNAATIRLTSGSTGNPQGIVHTSEALLSDDHNLSLTMGLTPNETILASVPLSHAYGFASILLPALAQRATLAVPEMGRPLSPMETAVGQRVTFLPTVPAYLQAILDMKEIPPLPVDLRLIISAGAPLSPETAARFREAYGLPIRVFYGASEVGGITFDRDGSAAERGTLGSPVENVQVQLEPAEGAEEDQGVVAVRSPSAAIGYLPEPNSNLKNGCFRTSDLATFRDGELVLLGRIDDLINVKGLKLNPREVETVLGQMEGVIEAVVFGMDDPGGSGQVVCAVASVLDKATGYDEIRRWCRDHLAAHKVPRKVATVDQIPRNARGKVDRAAVRALLTIGKRAEPSN
jgi:long-chain acyl-CoA synthetase